MNLIWVIQAKPLRGCCMELTFNDGSRKNYDFEKLIGTHPMYDFFRNSVAFNNYTLDGWTVSWNEGRVDVAPEYLYEHGTPVDSI